MTSSDSSLSEGRLGLYYGGMALSIIGLLVFLSVFVTGLGPTNGRPNVGSPSSSVVWVPAGQDPADTKSACGILGFDCNAEVRTYTGKEPPRPSWTSSSPSSSGPSNESRALVGIIMVIVGGALMNLGRAGLRGSGVILDPQGVREDLKPWNTARGGMLDDTLRGSEVITDMVERQGAPPQQTIKVRCSKCHALNDEDARFCKSCGAPL